MTCILRSQVDYNRANEFGLTPLAPDDDAAPTQAAAAAALTEAAAASATDAELVGAQTAPVYDAMSTNASSEGIFFFVFLYMYVCRYVCM